MAIAYVNLNAKAPYRREAFVNGFSRLGYSVSLNAPHSPLAPDDVLVTWNVLLRSKTWIDQAKAGGAAILVAENGYWGHDAQGVQNYALALGGHNGSGRWFAPDDSRLRALGIDFKPCRAEQGRKVVIAEQRGIGSPLMRSPPHFASEAVAKLKAHGYQPVLRPHPGARPPATRLMDDLADAAALVVWSSNCATQAMIEGVPTYFAAPAIVTSPAPRMFITGDLNKGAYDQLRWEGFARMAWAQWSLEEVTSGAALQTLIDVHRGVLPSCTRGLEP